MRPSPSSQAGRFPHRSVLTNGGALVVVAARAAQRAPTEADADLVDALGLIGQLLDQMVPGQKPRQPEKPKVDIGYRPVGFEEKPLDWMTF